MFVVIQNGCAIFGIGKTLKAAMRDAKAEGAQFDDLPRSTDVIGDFFWAPCTPALANEIVERGGAIQWDELADGTLCTVEEALK